MTVLYESKHVLLEVDEAQRIVRFTRSAEPFVDVADATRAFQDLARVAATLDRSRYGLLTDVRLAHGRNDPAFEQAIARYRNELFATFARRASLVRTMAGALQIQRLNREQHAPDVRIFQDENEAIAYLTAPRAP
jgi:hypothetical protein